MRPVASFRYMGINVFGFRKKKQAIQPADSAAAPALHVSAPEGYYRLTPPSPAESITHANNGNITDIESGWFARIRERFGKSAAHISDGIAAALTHRKLDNAALDAIEDTLITADCGPAAAAELRENLSKQRYGKDITEDDVRHLLADDITEMLQGSDVAFLGDDNNTPHVILFSGVNGSGKTTTIGKMAAYASKQNKKVMIAACDTFRAAAEEQIGVWAERAGATLITGAENADPASVAYRAIEKARESSTDLLLIDTAGRLQNKHNLMEELAKILRSLKKFDDAYPHASVIVLDAATGGNGLRQIEHFKDVAGVTAICMTKLDGTAKGGMLLNAVRTFGLPVAAIGCGEAIDDLHAFNARFFARCLTGCADTLDNLPPPLETL